MAAHHRTAGCPIWRRPLFRVTLQGIEVKCRSCDGQAHVFTWDDLAALRAELERTTPPETRRA